MAKMKYWDESNSQWVTLDAQDSDTVDGKHASDFADSGHNHTGGDITSQVDDSDKLDGYHASDFMMSSETIPETNFLEDSYNIQLESLSDESDSREDLETKKHFRIIGVRGGKVKITFVVYLVRSSDEWSSDELEWAILVNGNEQYRENEGIQESEKTITKTLTLDEQVQNDIEVQIRSGSRDYDDVAHIKDCRLMFDVRHSNSFKVIQ